MNEVIGVIGTGNIGKGILTHLAKTNYKVLVSNSRPPESIKEMLAGIGDNLTAVESRETIDNADILFLAIPWNRLAEFAKELAGSKPKIIVDATNNIISVNPFKLADIGNKSTGEYAASLFPEHRVVKAFNSLAAATLIKDPNTGKGKRVLFVNGDNLEANAKMVALISELGFAAIDLGTFQNGGKLQDVGGSLSGIELIKEK